MSAAYPPPRGREGGRKGGSGRRGRRAAARPPPRAAGGPEGAAAGGTERAAGGPGGRGGYPRPLVGSEGRLLVAGRSCTGGGREGAAGRGVLPLPPSPRRAGEGRRGWRPAREEMLLRSDSFPALPYRRRPRRNASAAAGEGEAPGSSAPSPPCMSEQRR